MVRSIYPVVAFAVLLVASLAHAQTAPTLSAEQCQADERIWSAEQRQRSDYEKLTFKQLEQRGIEMTKCVSVPPTKIKTPKDLANMYSMVALSTAYNSLAVDRLMRYLQRHNEGGQFVEFDAAARHSDPLQNFPIDRTPTSQKCQAMGNENLEPKLLTYAELHWRSTQMTQCVDSNQTPMDISTVSQNLLYSSQANMCEAETQKRMRHYLVVRHEDTQFLAEDAAGMR